MCQLRHEHVTRETLIRKNSHLSSELFQSFCPSISQLSVTMIETVDELRGVMQTWLALFESGTVGKDIHNDSPMIAQMLERWLFRWRERPNPPLPS